MNLYHKTLIISLTLVLAGCSTMETRRTRTRYSYWSRKCS